MARHYVEHEGKWNVFSSVIDDFILDDFVDFDKLKRLVIKEDIDQIRQHLRDIDTLLTDKPRVNKMEYEEALAIINCTVEQEDAGKDGRPSDLMKR